MKESISKSETHSERPSSKEDTIHEKNASSPDVPSEQETSQQGMTWNDWKKLPLQFTKSFLVVFCMWLGLLSVYWGSLYRREDRIKNMQFLVAIEDSSFRLSNSSQTSPIIGPMFENLLRANTNLGDFVLANVTELNSIASEKNSTVLEVLETAVHEQRYWGALHVNRNTSAAVYDLLISSNISSAAGSRVQSSITAVYESGRHYSALSQYVTKNIRTLQLAWTNNFVQQAYGSMIQSCLTSQQQVNTINSANSSSVGASFSYLPSLRLVDLRASKSAVVLGPSEVGLVYAQIFSFHQFNFSADLHNTVRERLRFRHFVFYRILFSQLNHLMLSLVYGLMTIAFRVPVDVAFGRSGFLVLWATMYLFISASGGLNECVCTIIFFYDKMFLLPPWIIANLVLNMAPTFAPFVLSPGFYRYGYAAPMLNAYEAMRVVFFDTWKGTLGRNYGVLAAWVVGTNIALYFILLFTSRQARKIKRREEEKKLKAVPNE